jgi:dTDP-4-dehydrorhamnose 3,5-epimerase
MTEITESPTIAGVKVVHLQSHADERGRFMETFRTAWFPERSWQVIQSNRSDSRAGVLRGLHYHFNQVDYWYVPVGRIRVGLADLRRSSPTFKCGQVLELGDDSPSGLFIPVGVAHGFLALSDATLTYTVDNFYSGADEFGVAWDDPGLALPWGHSAPALSERDRANPRLADIPLHNLPA